MRAVRVPGQDGFWSQHERQAGQSGVSILEGYHVMCWVPDDRPNKRDLILRLADRLIMMGTT